MFAKSVPTIENQEFRAFVGKLSNSKFEHVEGQVDKPFICRSTMPEREKIKKK